MISVSVIVTAFNSGKTVLETLGSIITQLEPSDEIVFVDDCSTDDTVQLIKSNPFLNSRVRVIRLKKNTGGPAGPRNIGVESASNDYIFFCDADDVWHPNKLNCQRVLLNSATVVASVCTNYYGGLIVWPESNCQFNRLSRYRFFLGNPIPLSSVGGPKHLFAKYKFPTESSFRAVEDFSVWLRMAMDGVEFCKLSSPLVAYRISDFQISRNKLKQLLKVSKVFYRQFGLFGLLFLPLYIINAVIRIITKKI